MMQISIRYEARKYGFYGGYALVGDVEKKCPVNLIQWCVMHYVLRNQRKQEIWCRQYFEPVTEYVIYRENIIVFI